MRIQPLLSGHEPPDDPLFEHIATELRERGMVVLPSALAPSVAEALWIELDRLDRADFHRAGVGRLDDHDVNRFVRRNHIHWIETEPAAWLDWTERLRLYLNRNLFLGLFSFESHFAVYEPGDFYKRHLDAFRGESNRVLSLVTYLNHDWAPDQGGELVIYPERQPPVRVTPGFGTLVIFLSEAFPHEVLPATRRRYSVAGWYRLNATRADRVDPPR